MANGLHLRIDNRLLHGQVVQFWIPYLEVDRLIIADDDVSADGALHAVYRAALPERVALVVTEVADTAHAVAQGSAAVTLVLVSNVDDARRALEAGLELGRLTLGNVHAAADRTRVTDSVHLSGAELASLAELSARGLAVEIQTFPGETLRLVPDEEGAPRWSKR
jgi:PTS system mannose-specific IIB component